MKGLGGLLMVALTVSAWAGAKPAMSPTFDKDVAPILYKDCGGCPRPGEVAPMSLMNYKEARPWVKSIREKVVARAMPPWPVDRAYGKFAGERGLTPDEINTIVSWVDGGAREGDPKDLPPVPTYPAGWQLGKPDAVFEVVEDYSVPSEGVVEYQHFVVPTGFTEDKWVQAAEIRSNHIELVHHVIVFVQPPPEFKMKPFGVNMRREAQLPREPDAVIKVQRVNRGRLGLFMAAAGSGGRCKLVPPCAGVIIHLRATMDF